MQSMTKRKEAERKGPWEEGSRFGYGAGYDEEDYEAEDDATGDSGAQAEQ